MLENINIRFFAYDRDANDELDIVEIEEDEFDRLAYDTAWCGDPAHRIRYERHTVAENGVRQVCLTVRCDRDGDPV